MNWLRTLPPVRRLALAALAVVVPAAGFLAGCTDLNETPYSGVEPENFYRTDAEVTAAIVPVYAQLRATLWAYHNLSQVTSDETIVPTRGSDWADGGRWLSMHRHDWDANLVDLNDAWVAAYTGIARANGILQDIDPLDIEGKEEIAAELRALRAFYYYQLLDFFGAVPILGDQPGEFLADPDNPPQTETRETVFNFIVAELEAVRDQISDTPAGRIKTAAADAMLANLYLNAAVFKADVLGGNGVNTSGYNSCAAAGTCQAAVDAVDRILASGDYSLATDWRGIFEPDNAANPEHIFVVEYLAVAGLGMSFPMRYLHYNQFDPSPWNGFSTIAETYNAFSDQDVRKDVFLVGQQFNVETGAPVNDRNDNPLIFTEECGDVNNTTENACVRIAKFPADTNAPDGDGHGNDYAFFRLGEMYLIKAEALNEMGRTGEAVPLVNALRERVYDGPEDGLDAFLVPADISQADLRTRLLDERLFELLYEAKRRQDLVRWGQFDEAWEYKEASEPFRVVFPIPQVQLDANPNLDQNIGAG